MIFDELTEDNFLLFAIKNYENPQSVTKEDFHKDLNHFKYVKRLIRKYKNNESLKAHLIINHCIILYNIFGDAATPMFFYKLEEDLWSVIKTFIVFLNKLPEYPRCYIHEISIDENCMKTLQSLTDGKQKN
jgi:hypothetical protein